MGLKLLVYLLVSNTVIDLWSHVFGGSFTAYVSMHKPIYIFGIYKIDYFTIRSRDSSVRIVTG